MANNGLCGHFAGTSAYPPTADIRWPMSVIVPISSAYPSGADVPGRVSGCLSLTPSRHSSRCDRPRFVFRRSVGRDTLHPLVRGEIGPAPGTRHPDDVPPLRPSRTWHADPQGHHTAVAGRPLRLRGECGRTRGASIQDEAEGLGRDFPYGFPCCWHWQIECC